MTTTCPLCGADTDAAEAAQQQRELEAVVRTLRERMDELVARLPLIEQASTLHEAYRTMVREADRHESFRS
jgi:hypothetical protein